LLLNVGTNDGVERKMRFQIFTPSEEIVDPETGEVLGSYSRRKTTVEADQVFERFTIASRPYIYERSPRDLGILGAGEQVWPDLPVSKAEIQPLPTGTRVRIGDRAVQEVEGDLSVVSDETQVSDSDEEPGSGDDVPAHNEVAADDEATSEA
jgi:hypothetical protein